MSRPARITVCAMAACILVPLAALGQESVATTFDFSSVQSNQAGTYVLDPSVELTAGAARPRLSTGDWAGREHRVRVEIAVDDVPVETPRGIVELDVGLLPVPFATNVLANGTDLVAFDSSHSPLPRPFITRGTSLSTGVGLILVKQDTLLAGSSSFFLYGGDVTNATVVDELSFLTDPSPTVRYYTIGSYSATDLTVGTMVADNELAYTGGSVLLAEPGDAVLMSGSTAGDVLTAAGPVGGSWLGAGADAVVPESFAGTSFVIPAPRFDEDVFVVAPFADATLTFTNPALTDVLLTLGSVQKISTLVADGQVIVFDADVPVVVVRGSTSGDITPMPPAATELLGVASGTVAIAAGPSGASVTVYASDSTSQVSSVPANSVVSVSGDTQGQGSALRLSSTSPIGALAYGDGDGAEAVAFLPPGLLGTSFLLPEGAQFMVMAADEETTHCDLTFPADGSVLATGTTSASSPPTPGRLFFGSPINGLNLTALSLLECDKPIYALYEAAATDSEKLLIAASNHHPHVWSMTVSSSPAETRFAAGTSHVSTPTLSIQRFMNGIAAMSVTSQVETGGALRFQMSLDGGASWLIPVGGTLQADTSGDGASAASFLGVQFSPSQELTLRALLESDGLADVSIDEVVVEASLEPAVDLALALSDESDPLVVGQASTYTMTVTNLGPSAATGVTATLTLPAALAFVASNPGSPTCQESLGTITCGLGSIAASDSRLVEVSFVEVAGSPDLLTATASVQGVETDPSAGNNAASETTEVVAVGAVAFIDGFESGDTSAWARTVP